MQPPAIGRFVALDAEQVAGMNRADFPVIIGHDRLPAEDVADRRAAPDETDAIPDEHGGVGGSLHERAAKPAGKARARCCGAVRGMRPSGEIGASRLKGGNP
jgi:hypothetical protein